MANKNPSPVDMAGNPLPPPSFGVSRALKWKPQGLWGSIVFLAAILWCSVVMAGTKPHPFETLQQHLVSEGFDNQHLEPIFNHPSVRFDLATAASFFRHSESRLNYAQFTTKRQIAMGHRYMKKHKAALNRAQQHLGISGNVITAILLVETQLGAHVGNRSVFNTVASLATLNQFSAREQLWRRLTKKRKLSRKYFSRRVFQKARFGYENLKALLQFTRVQNLHPLKITGSYAGAFGIGQFIPTSAIQHAMDGNGDGKIDLFNHEDAIFSTAAYLKHYGWRPGISSKDAHDVILKYNRSGPYARTVLKLTRQLTPNS